MYISRYRGLGQIGDASSASSADALSVSSASDPSGIDVLSAATELVGMAGQAPGPGGVPVWVFWGGGLLAVALVFGLISGR
jgi:hypothetical protein